MLEEIKANMRMHNNYLSEYACKDSEALFFKENKEDIRGSFFRDIDRIIYSLAFIRYQGKTQVFSLKGNDHISVRMIHVQFVSKIARTIGRALGLNEDLIEAAALGHDLGHTPFGHEGERILNKISLENGEGLFNHNIESVRNLMNIENYGKGLNISLQVLDAIMCHNGEVALGKYEPIVKTKSEFLEEYNVSYNDKNVILTMRPMTLEGCVVRISDLIAYLGRDIEDGIRKHLIKKEDIPESITSVLGNNTRDIVNVIVMDIIKNSYGHSYIKLSDEVYNAIEELKKFNYQYIYAKSMSKNEKEKLEEMFRTLFTTYLNDLETNNMNSSINNSYLKNMVNEYKIGNSNARIVIDYIAGMTDDFFLNEYKRINHEN